jgi:peptidoglycan hydrolase-like protein with peptidoglycan-binding domain
MGLIIAVIAILALIAYWFWCEQEKLALRYPAYPLRCDDAFALSDANSGFESATRLTAPTLSVQPVVSSAVNQVMSPGVGASRNGPDDDIADTIPEKNIAPGKGDGYDPMNVERAARWDISAMDGSWWADGMRRGIPLSGQESDDVPRRFRILNQTEGVLGFHRLALAYLGPTAFQIAQSGPDSLRVPHCPGPVYMPPHPMNPVKAYTHFTLIEQECKQYGIVNAPDDAQGWRDAIRSVHPNHERWFSWVDRNAYRILTRMIERHNPELDPEEPEDRRKFCLGLPKSEGGSSQVSCVGATKARQALKLGDAAQAAGRSSQARACWLAATQIAQTDPDGAEAGMIAQRRLQATTSTCKPTEQGLARISRDYKARTGDLIRVMVLKHALKALGHYDGPLDDRLSEETREAIARFQREREEDQTGTLTPEQTTMLVCSAAESTRDLVAETTLGVMYIIGLGVSQNIDQAHDWLTEASSRKYPDATYNLAILYGTGIILNSYRLCDVPRSPEQADRYLQEAAYQGHPEARRLYAEFGPGSRYGDLSPRERWAVIEMQLEQRRSNNALYSGKLSLVGAKCELDRSVR